jgi:hypothetical protein
VNHKVHLCMRGCLTLKLSGSWNTVICASSADLSPFDALLPPSGEMGMVDRSTGEAGLSAPFVDSVETAAMIVGEFGKVDRVLYVRG